MTAQTIAIAMAIGGPVAAFFLYEVATLWLEAIRYQERHRP